MYHLVGGSRSTVNSVFSTKTSKIIDIDLFNNTGGKYVSNGRMFRKNVKIAKKKDSDKF